ncbi:putative transcription factor SSL1 [Gregarina niphandrodes]|uniref:Transcription factor SSL1 n=1 Tax=Gregarina niphandrodes TaxID=110365 RepID=A0A023B169_GRENI|nr:putative transcription factor SSL1 [Gregarina niphandrodes]EZG46113.1 putative transcription factor SSL1 [Gregarina niphandrodes]|eukprot:XP_011132369.1 putative transcription factor SSL1 [Gregarina niphandrodes]
MEAVARIMVEDLLDLEAEEQEQTAVWGLMDDPWKESGAKKDRFEWRKGVDLYVDKEGRISRPYLADLDPARADGTVVLRSVVVLIDYGEMYSATDTTSTSGATSGDFIVPLRISSVAVVKEFIDDFFELCPLGELGVVLMYNKTAHVLTAALTSNHQMLKDLIDDEISRLESGRSGTSRSEGAVRSTLNGPEAALEDAVVIDGVRAAQVSLQAGLEKCYLLLNNGKSYSRKEVLCIWNSTATHDAGLIGDTIDVLRTHNIQINVISLTPHLHVLERLTSTCHGDYTVIRNEAALKDQLITYSKAQAPSTDLDNSKDLIPIGFPEWEQGLCAALCTCHNQLKFNSYACPRCLARNCSIPSNCAVCGLLLAKSLDIARCSKTSYNVPPFQPLPPNKKDCYMCDRVVLSGAGVCLKCNQVFCLDCDVNIHEYLLPCPGCQYIDLLSRQGLQTRSTKPEPPLPEDHPQYNFYQDQLKLIQED